jgi:nicotinamidase/pyrazinamidase
VTTVFVDVDTQLDFLFPAGALYVPGAERIVPAIAALNRHAGARGIPLISTTDAQAENDPEFKDWPPHCVAGTLGARKPASTLLDSVVSIPSVRSSFSIAGAKQIILEKQTIDAFTNANLPGILESLGADRYVVYGVVTEVCVKCAVAGLLKTGKPVAIVGDAVRHLNEHAAREVLSMCAVTSVSQELAA